MRVRRDNLMVIAGIVWLVAGINVALVGLQAYGQGGFGGWVLAALIAGSVVVSGAFHGLFGRIVRKQVTRIHSYEEKRLGIHRFFDRRGYIMMLVMSTFGIALRAFGLVPGWFVAFFYTGLGISLAFAGVGFILHRVKGADWQPHAAHHLAKSA